MTATYVYFVIFACAGYLIVTDPSIAKAVTFGTHLITNKFQVFRWWFVHNPRTPWARYVMHKRSMKMAEELMKEFQDKK